MVNCNDTETMKWLNMNERVRVTTRGKCQLRCRRGRQTRRGVWCACGGQLLLHNRGERESAEENTSSDTSATAAPLLHPACSFGSTFARVRQELQAG